MLSNTGSKQRFPCQQFRAPSQPVTLQSASFGYGNTDSLSLCLENLKLFIKVHTRVLKHRQECDGWVQRTSPLSLQRKKKNGQRNDAVFIIQLVMLVIGVFLTGSRVLYSFSPLLHIFYYFCDCFNPGRWNIGCQWSNICVCCSLPVAGDIISCSAVFSHVPWTVADGFL